jgi:hypothetical protein
MEIAFELKVAAVMLVCLGFGAGEVAEQGEWLKRSGPKKQALHGELKGRRVCFDPSSS